MKRQHLVSLINDLLKEQLKGITSINDNELLTGYNPLEKIMGKLFWWVAVPFNGQDVWCQLRCPNATQIEQCGDMSNIVIEKYEGLKEGESPKYDYDEIIQIRNYHEELCKLVFNVPTFDQIASLVGDNDFLISAKRKELQELRDKYEANKEGMSKTEQDIIETQMRTIELQIGFILPDDTMSFVAQWAMGNDISDIKKITKENFLRAASLARLHRKAPSDYLSGVFTDFNKHEIDTYAAMVLDEHLEEHKALQESQYNWIGRGSKKTSSLLPKRNGGQ